MRRPMLTILSALALSSCAQPSGGNPVASMPPAQGAAGDVHREEDMYARAARTSPFEEWKYPVAPDVNNGTGAASPMPAQDFERTRNPAWSPPLAQSIDDGKILTIAQTTSLMELQLARTAEARASDPQVRAMAARLADQQERIQDRVARVELRRGVRPERSAAADQVRADIASKIQVLQQKQGPDFDRSYLELQAQAQHAAIDRLDEQLVPSATEPAVVQLVRELRPTVERNYAQTRALQLKMGK